MVPGLELRTRPKRQSTYGTNIMFLGIIHHRVFI
jgi:hypothetical protein